MAREWEWGDRWGEWWEVGVVNRVRRRDLTEEPLVGHPLTQHGHLDCWCWQENPSGMRGYPGVIQMDPAEDRELTILQEPIMERIFKKNKCVFMYN